MVAVTALGGSTNAVLHLLAIAHAFELKLELADFQNVSNRVPLLADLNRAGSTSWRICIASAGRRRC